MVHKLKSEIDSLRSLLAEKEEQKYLPFPLTF